MKKVSFRRKKTTAEAMSYFVSFCSLTQKRAHDVGLPTGKVDRVMAFGGLTFCTNDYFVLICCVENIFRNILSEEALVIHGSFLLDKILRNILENSCYEAAIKGFLPPQIDEDTIEIIGKYLLSIYTRMRAKDFAYKLLKKGSKLKTCTRTLQAVLANPAHRAKKQRKYFSRVAEINNVVNEILDIDDDDDE